GRRRVRPARRCSGVEVHDRMPFTIYDLRFTIMVYTGERANRKSKIVNRKSRYPSAGLRRRKIVSTETPLWMRWITSASIGATEIVRSPGQVFSGGGRSVSVMTTSLIALVRRRSAALLASTAWTVAA